MTDRVREMVLDEVERIPSRPGDLAAVRERARRRHQHRRVAVAVLAVTVVAGALAAGLTLQQQPRAPFIGGDASGTAFVLEWCPEEVCGDLPVPPEQALAELANEPWVRSVEYVDPAESWERMTAELEPEQLEDVSRGAVPPMAEIVVERDEAVLDIALELHETAPGAGVSLRWIRPADPDWTVLETGERWDPSAVVGRRLRVFDGDHALETWRIEDGGVCFGLGDMVSCHPNHLWTGTDISTNDQGGWGSLDNGTSCAWGRTSMEVQEVVVTYDDGTQVPAELGIVPDVVLGQVYLACSPAGGYPMRIEATDGSDRTSVAAHDLSEIVLRRGE